ncbi:phage tail protein [Agrobacterium rosae]|uniref:pyocin knob domain-containing protein n=1 Tax=Agrobacterium rosae TaxID=1972867 RepID=UPI0019D341F6|nr:pyocin knob domain-containing protein [Agrobacterium rosae]MBN7804919.1 phage tail protein [Agrobacterium rosae]
MTTPYVTGTVSVTAGSAIVTGVGTGWLTSGLVAGQFGLDSANGNPVPVLSIDSDTQITLAKPWRGTSASAQPYWITYDTTPGQQTVANAQRLAEYIARLDKPALAALAGLTLAADKLAYFTGPNGAALMDFNAAARALLAGGVLPDGQLPARLKTRSPYSANLNNELDGGWRAANPDTLNTPIPGYYVVQVLPFLFGENSCVQIAYSFGNNVHYRRSIQGSVISPWVSSGTGSVGTVSMQGGFATGAVIERGSNANGEYVRFADGTQICWRRYNQSLSIPYPVGGLFRSAAFTASYAVSFSARPIVTASYVSTVANNEFDVSAQSAFEDFNPNSQAHIILTALQSKSAADRAMNIVAIGRWF